MATASKTSEASGSRLELTRGQIVRHRLRANGLDERPPYSHDSLRRAAWAGLQDSAPRAALLSLHARVAGATPMSWEDPSLVQVWGPRFSAYAVAAVDRAVFTLGRLPIDPTRRAFAEDLASRLDAFLDGRTMTYNEAGRALGKHPNMLRYAATTGRVLIRWDGARPPTIWTLPAPDVDPADARLELARRYLHVFGPGTAASFAKWAGVRPPAGPRAFAELGSSIVPVRTPAGDEWILADDEGSFRAGAGTGPGASGPGAGGPGVAAARFLPGGDAYWLLQGPHREILVPDRATRLALWTPRVWPGALLVDGEIAGTWRRAERLMEIQPWRMLTPQEREAVEAEAASLPLPGLRGPIDVRWAAAP